MIALPNIKRQYVSSGVGEALNFIPFEKRIMKSKNHEISSQARKKMGTSVDENLKESNNPLFTDKRNMYPNNDLSLKDQRENIECTSSDYDNKNDKSGKFTKYCVEQVKYMSHMLSVFQSQFKSVSEQNSSIITELSKKIKNIEEKSTLNPCISKTTKAIQNPNEIISVLNIQSAKTENEINLIKQQFINNCEKESSTKTQMNEKINLLFNEIVKTNKEIEIMRGQIHTLANKEDTKLQMIENKINQNLAEVKNPPAFNDSINEKKLFNVENNMLFLEKEIKCCKEGMMQIQVISSRMAEDLHSQITLIQKDLSMKIDDKLNDAIETMGKVLEEKIKINPIQKIHSNITSKDMKMEAEGEVNPNSFDNPKPEMHIQQSYDAQILAINSLLKKDEISRTKDEANIKKEISQISEDLRNELEAYKKQNGSLSEKMTEMIKLEVEYRLVSEKNNRMMIESLIRGIVEDIKLFKESVDKQNKHFLMEIKNVGSESSERAQALSIYIDNEIKKAGDYNDSQIQKFKSLLEKVTEQIQDAIFKLSITNNEPEKKNEMEILKIQQNIDSLMKQTEFSITDLAVKTILDKCISMIEFDQLVTIAQNDIKNAYLEVEEIRKATEDLTQDVQSIEANTENRIIRGMNSIREEIERKILLHYERIKKERDNNDLIQRNVIQLEKPPAYITNLSIKKIDENNPQILLNERKNDNPKINQQIILNAKNYPIPDQRNYIKS